MSKHIQPNLDDGTFDSAVQMARRRLMSLISAIGTLDYFDAWLAGVQLRVALERAERLVGLGLMSSESRLFGSRRLDDIRSIATPMLALAPAPSRQEIRQMHTSDAHRDRRTMEHVEQQWKHSVLRQLTVGIFKENDHGEKGESEGNRDDDVSDQVLYSNSRRERLLGIRVYTQRKCHSLAIAPISIVRVEQDCLRPSRSTQHSSGGRGPVGK